MSKKKRSGSVAGEATPKDWLPGLVQNWKTDAVAGFVVFLIALPLSLGIALASGMPPIAGVISAIIGGVVVSLLSGSYITINGPAAGLIVIVLGAVTELGGGNPAAGYRYALAVGVACGAIQILLGLLKAGRLTDFFPLSVVHGMLAGIGVIIIVKQIFLALGATAPKVGMIHLIESIPSGFAHLNPAIALIGLVSILIMVLWPMMKNRLAKAVPRRWWRRPSRSRWAWPSTCRISTPTPSWGRRSPSAPTTWSGACPTRSRPGSRPPTSPGSTPTSRSDTS